MIRDPERIRRIQNALHDAGLDAVVCGQSTNVLLLTGYWPVVGTSLAIATRHGQIGLVVPEDERELAAEGWADELLTFAGGSLTEIKSTAQCVCPAFADMAARMKLAGRIGFENEPGFEPASYAAMHIYGETVRELLAAAAPALTPAPASPMLAKLRLVKTAAELQHIRTACAIAREAFTEGARTLRAGVTETEAAAPFRVALGTRGIGRHGVGRADGYVYCMSGPNSAEADAAYQRSRARKLVPGDFALIHCNSYADGYWTDITRTFCIGEPDARQRGLYAAIFAARDAALQAIMPGVKASAVDRAARDLLARHGFAKEFTHPTGHGVGFAAINHNAPPRIHPVSEETLETGMVFNVEPGIYFNGYGGLRHCEMVAVNPDGAEVLTPFQETLAELIVG
jgi:Xaa-Pro aminopeptidase